MGKTLRDLSNTYEDCIAVQEQVIERYRKQLREAHKSYNMKEVQRLNSLLRVLYDEKMELQMTAHEINRYCS